MSPAASPWRRVRLGLASIDDLDDLPIYGRVERVRIKNMGGAWQEATITVHWQREIDTRNFREFLSQAIASYHAMPEGAAESRKLFRASDLEPTER